MKKKFLAAVLALTFILALIPAGILSAATVDGYEALSGTITKQSDNSYVLSPEAMIKKGTLSEGRLDLKLPMSSMYQQKHNAGVVFGAENMSTDEASYYFVYRYSLNNVEYVKIQKVVGGVDKTSELSGTKEVNIANLFSTREYMTYDEIVISVYFTDDGYISVEVENELVIEVQDSTPIAGSEYGLRAEKNTANPNFVFNSLEVTESNNDYKLVTGGVTRAEGGLQATDIKTLFAYNETCSKETLIRFSISNYGSVNSENNYYINLSGTRIDNDNYSGVVFGLRNENATEMEGNAISYYFFFVNYDNANPENTTVGFVRSDGKGSGSKWSGLATSKINVSAGYADGSDTDTISDHVQANGAVEGYIYYNSETGVMKAYLDGAANNCSPIVSYTETDTSVQMGSGYGVRCNPKGVIVSAKAETVTSNSSDYAVRNGSFVYTQDGRAFPLNYQSSIFSTKTVTGSDIWYKAKISDGGVSNNGIIIAAHLDETKATSWESPDKGYFIWLNSDGGLNVGRYGSVVGWQSFDALWLPKDVRDNYSYKDIDGAATEVYDIRVNYVYYKDTGNADIHIYVGGKYLGTVNDNTTYAIDPNGSKYGYRSNTAGGSFLDSFEITSKPKEVGVTALTGLGREKNVLVDYNHTTGEFRTATDAGETTIILANEPVSYSKDGEDVKVKISVDMTKQAYSNNSDDGVVFAYTADGNGAYSYYRVFIGDLGSGNDVIFRLCKSTNASNLVSGNDTWMEIDSEAALKRSTFKYIAGDTLHIDIVYDGKGDIDVYADGTLVLEYLDTAENEETNATSKAPLAPFTGTRYGVITEFGGTVYKNLKAEINPALLTGGGTYKTNSDTGLSFTCDNSISSVYIDDSTTALESSKYTLSADGKTVTLAPDYLRTLTENSHKITVDTVSGKSSATFKVDFVGNIETSEITFTTGDETGLEFEINTLETPTVVKVDGSTLGSDDFSIDSSMKLTLKPAYLETLAQKLGSEFYELSVEIPGSVASEIAVSKFYVDVVAVLAPEDAENNKFTTGDANGLSFAATHAFNSSKIYVDGTTSDPIAESAYTVSGNKLTLSAAYLETLGEGTHKVCVLVGNETVECTFTVDEVPSITANGNSTFTKGSDAGLAFDVTHDVVSVKVNGDDLDSTEYSYEDGKLTLNASYLEGLDNNVYTVQAVTAVGETATVEFVVSTNPGTGDMTFVFFAAAIVTVLAAAFVSAKKRFTV